MDPLKRTETDRRVNSVLQGWELLRTLHNEVPGQAVSCLLYIASHNPCHKQAIEEDLEFSTASSSRMIDFLCVTNRLKKPGLGLVEKYSDPSNGRRHLLRLTPKGEDFIDQFKDAIYGVATRR